LDIQQEYLAKPRLLAISEIDRALDDCRKVLDQALHPVLLLERTFRRVDESEPRRHRAGRDAGLVIDKALAHCLTHPLHEAG
jgi:hypothetical protein